MVERDRKDKEIVKVLGDLNINPEDLLQYTSLDNFKAKQYLRDIDLKTSRYRWCGPDSYITNDHAKQHL